MKNKIFLIFVFLVLFSFSVSAGDYRVIYLTTNVNIYEQDIIDIFESEGFDVDLVDNQDLVGMNWSQYDMIFSGSFNFNNWATIPVNQMPALVLGASGNIEDWEWSNGVSITGSTQPLHAHNQNDQHTIGYGLPYDFQIYTDCCNGALSIPVHFISRWDRAYDTEPVISTVSDHLNGIVVAIDVGDKLKDNSYANARGVFFGIAKNDYWTSSSETLFRNSIEWLLFGNDLDGDGYYSDDDCDDENPDAYPGAEEIPYDGVDNNCDGNVLDDLDADGYYSNLAIGGSPDCNDGDESIHPGAIEIIDDIDQNCVNDVPVLTSVVPSATWDEDVTKNNFYNLDHFFVDYEGDEIIYSSEGNININVNIEDNLVDLIPNENWFGTENVRFKAYDGVGYGYSGYATLKVLSVNDAPVIEPIENIVVYAGDLVKITPNVSDVENDEINITYGSPLDVNGEWQTTEVDVGSYLSYVKAADAEDYGYEYFNIEVRARIVINELLTNGDEWVELYNPNDEIINIDGWTLEDGTGVPQTLSGTIGPLSFEVVDNNFGLNNGGDIVILKEGEVIIDSVTYGDYDDGNLLDNADVPGVGESLGRISDGYDTNVDNVDFTIYEYPTKGFGNLADAQPPIVTLESPSDGSSFVVDSIYFSYRVTDNIDDLLECKIYSDVNGEWGVLANQPANNGESTLFLIYNITDGNYLWNIECEDDNGNKNVAENNWSFSVDVNDAPVIEPIENIEINELENINFEVFATDSDSENLTYSAENLPGGANFDVDTHIFYWNTDYEDAGIYNLLFIVGDGKLNSTEEVQITVNNVNRDPIFTGNIDNVSFDEDESLNDVFDLDDYFSDLDNDEFSYSLEDNSHVKISINDGIISFSADANWNGVETLRFKGNDGNGGIAYSNYFIVTVNSVNDDPEITSYSPNYLNPKITEDGSITFSIEKNDVDNSNLTVEWKVDGVLVDDGDSYTFNANGVGEYEIRVQVYDGTSYSNYIEWNLITSDKPLTDIFNGDTTDFDNVDVNAVYNLTLERVGYGKIFFPGPIDMRNIVDLDRYAGIDSYIIGIDTNKLFELSGKEASLWFYNLDFSEEPDIYYNNGFDLSGATVNNKCSNVLCENREYVNNIMSFDVEHFTTFRVGEFVSQSCSSLGGFTCKENEMCSGNELRDSNTNSVCCSVRCEIDFSQYDDLDWCKYGVVGDIEITNIDFDEDDFRPGETMPIEVDVDNNADEDLDVTVEVSLYNIDEDKVIAEVEFEDEVQEDDDLTFELELKIPIKDLDENDDYLLYVKAYEKEKDHCSEEIEELNLDLNKNEVIINEINIVPSGARCGEYVSVNSEIINVGSNDQEGIVMKLENNELNLNEISNAFDLDKFGDKDDDAIIDFSFTIPEDTIEGTYNIMGNLEFDGGSYSLSEDIEVVDCGETIEGLLGIGELELITDTISTTIGSDIRIPIIVRNLGNNKAEFKVETIAEGGFVNDIILTTKLDGKKEARLYLDMLNRQEIVGTRNVEILLKEGGIIIDRKNVQVNMGSVVTTSLKEGSLSRGFIGATLLTGFDTLEIFPNDNAYIISLIVLIILALTVILFLAKKLFKGY